MKFFRKLFSSNYCHNSNNVFQSNGNNFVGDQGFNFKGLNNTITINGKTYKGNSSSIINGKVFIDGTEIKDKEITSSKVLNISITGDIKDCEILNCNSIKIEGDVGYLDNQNGNITITGNIQGDIDNQNGNIKCGDVSGSIDIQNGNVIKNK